VKDLAAFIKGQAVHGSNVSEQEKYVKHFVHLTEQAINPLKRLKVSILDTISMAWYKGSGPGRALARPTGTDY
jgi:hypothetical protein